MLMISIRDSKMITCLNRAFTTMLLTFELIGLQN